MAEAVSAGAEAPPEAPLNTAAALAEVSRYRALRWVGVVLFITALLPVSLILFNVATGQSPGLRLLNCVLCLGLSLGTFGTSNDTALTTMDRLYRHGALQGDALAEHQHEARVRPARLAEGHHNPRMALVMPILAMLAIGWSSYRALSEAGWVF